MTCDREIPKPYPEQTTYVALACDVVAVAITRQEGKWCAYCKAVRGFSHEDEWQEVLRTGEKLSETIAKAIFPDFAALELPYAR